MGYFGKAIALLFSTEILNQNTAFLVHKDTSNRVKSWLKRIYALFGVVNQITAFLVHKNTYNRVKSWLKHIYALFGVVWVKFWMKKIMIKNGVFW